jgi:hypothetical protein
MGVYTSPGKIHIAMDLPHPVIWMEASASMPVVLKDRVIEAFQKLHERGVVHGAVALRHILIGADARVTVIDFKLSRADEPNEELGINRAYPGEKDLEMRRVRFLINVDNARKKELKKSVAAVGRSSRNKQREQQRRELLQLGITVGLPWDEPEPAEDIKEPPVPLNELKKFWMEDANDNPRRFIVPGSTVANVDEAISSFLQCIQDIEGADCGWSVFCDGPSSPRSPLASPPLSPLQSDANSSGLPIYNVVHKDESSSAKTGILLGLGDQLSETHRILNLPLKRREEVTYVEGYEWPTKKRLRLESLDYSSLKIYDAATSTEEKIVSGCQEDCSLAVLKVDVI